MAVLPVLAVGIFWKFVGVLFVLVAVLLILVILIQKGRGGGLSGAFGGGMAGGLLGSKTGDFLTWVTIGLVGVFLLLAILMAKFYRNELPGEEPVSRPRQNVPAQTTPETPVPANEANTPVTAAPGGASKPATAAPAPKPEVRAPAPATGAADANKPATR